MSSKHPSSWLRSHVVTAILLALAMVVAACDGATVETSTTPADGDVTTTAGAETTSTEPEPVDEDLVVAIEPSIQILDPDGTATDDNVSVILHIFDPLLDRDPSSGELLPRLAESWQWVDNQTFEVVLRDGAVFHNGDPVTPADVQFTLERVQNEETGSLRADLLSGVTGLEIDGNTIRFQLAAPDVVFPEILVEWPILNSNVVGANPEWATDAATLSDAGSGPYRLTEWRVGTDLTLERNDDYWGEPPIYRTVVIRTVPEPATRAAELASGGVDIADKLLPDQIPELEGVENISVITKPTLSQTIVQLDGAGRTDPDSPFTDVRVRQAVNMALNVDEIIEFIFNGAATRVAAGVTPLQKGFDPSIEPYPYDPAQAQQLMDEAGYGDGFDARLIIQPFVPAHEELGGQIVSDLAEIGINVTLEEIVDGAAVGQVVREGQAGPMVEFGLSAGGRFDASASYTSIFRCENAFSYYCNPEFDALYEQQASSVDPDERQELLSQLQQIARDDAAHLFLYAANKVWGVSDDVEWPGYEDRNLRLYTASPAG